MAHYNLAVALRASGQTEAAIRHYEEVIRIAPRHAKAHFGLGVALRARGQVEAAIGHYEEALRIDPNYAEAHCNLGHALQHQGRFEEALVRLKQGHQLGSKRPKWRYSSAQWVRHAERLLLLDGKLPAILRGQARPADAEEQLDLAELCRLKKRYAAATRFAADAFVVRPALADDHRYDAACDAARAGRGQGQDAVGLSDAEKARLRRQAREWLGAELDLRATQLIRDRRAVEGALRHWLEDPNLDGVRDPASLAQLPEGERREWRSLWQQVERLLGKDGK
jgi:tetratricopeptide (TPR) repeat protein